MQNREIKKAAQEEYNNYCWLLKCPLVVCLKKPKFTGSISSILPENMLALFIKLCDSYKPLTLDNAINADCLFQVKLFNTNCNL